MPIKLTMLCLILMVGPLASLAQTQAPPEPEGDLKTALEARADAGQGKADYENCEGCHRKDGSGRANGTYPRLAGQHSTVIIKQLVDIRSGRRHNPDMAPLVADPVLSLQAMANIAAHVQSLPVLANNGKGPGTDLDAGRRLYERDCAVCHGAAGEGLAQSFYPMVAAQHYRYLLRELVNIRDGTRRNSHPAMVKVVTAYAPGELDSVADYMARLPPPKR